MRGQCRLHLHESRLAELLKLSCFFAVVTTAAHWSSQCRKRGCQPLRFDRPRYYSTTTDSWASSRGVLLSSLFMLAQCAGAAGARPLPVVDPAVRAALQTGPARVLIELRITPDFRPEGDLPGSTVEAQRRAIAEAQADILSRLSGTEFALARQYDTVPVLALEIDSDALARLEAAGDLVARVILERRLSPQL